jgi:hypothetical protein
VCSSVLHPCALSTPLPPTWCECFWCSCSCASPSRGILVDFLISPLPPVFSAAAAFAQCSFPSSPLHAMFQLILIGLVVAVAYVAYNHIASQPGKVQKGTYADKLNLDAEVRQMTQ